MGISVSKASLEHVHTPHSHGDVPGRAGSGSPLGHQKDLGSSKVIGSEDVEHSRTIQMGSQEVYDYYCQPCDVDDHHVQATVYCDNCKEYLCMTCGMAHKKLKQFTNHEILDVQKITHKPPINKKMSTISNLGKSRSTASINQATTVSTNPGPAYTRQITMATSNAASNQVESSAFPSAVTYVKTISCIGDINSMTLMSTNQLLLLFDRRMRIRLVDTETGRQVSEMFLPGKAWQVTRISDTKAAVTVPDRHIFLLKTKPGLLLLRDIYVEGNCNGIAYIDKKFIVTDKNGHVDILDMAGKVLRTISTDQTGEKIFSRPEYVTGDTATGCMYVSDPGLDKMVQLNTMEETYIRDRISSCTHGYVALDSQGMVYLARIGVHCTKGNFGGVRLRWFGFVEQLNADLDKVRTIIPNLPSSPTGLAIDNATQQLYVGQLNGEVEVYKLS